MFRNVWKLLHEVQNQLLVRNYLQLRINSLQQESVHVTNWNYTAVLPMIVIRKFDFYLQIICLMLK